MADLAFPRAAVTRYSPPLMRPSALAMAGGIALFICVSVALPASAWRPGTGLAWVGLGWLVSATNPRKGGSDAKPRAKAGARAWPRSVPDSS